MYILMMIYRSETSISWSCRTEKDSWVKLNERTSIYFEFCLSMFFRVPAGRVNLSEN